MARSRSESAAIVRRQQELFELGQLQSGSDEHGYHPRGAGGTPRATEVLVRVTGATSQTGGVWWYDWEEIELLCTGRVQVKDGGRTSADPIGAAYTVDETYAAIATPASPAVLTNTTITFTWNEPVGADEYKLQVGSTRGGHEYYDGAFGAAASQEVTGLPDDGTPVYVRLTTKMEDTTEGVNEAWYWAKGSPGMKFISLEEQGNGDGYAFNCGINPAATNNDGVGMTLQPIGGTDGGARDANKVPVMIRRMLTEKGTQLWVLLGHQNGVEVTC
jgi:hypothetical protein